MNDKSEGRTQDRHLEPERREQLQHLLDEILVEEQNPLGEMLNKLVRLGFDDKTQDYGDDAEEWLYDYQMRTGDKTIYVHITDTDTDRGKLRIGTIPPDKAFTLDSGTTEVVYKAIPSIVEGHLKRNGITIS